MARNPKPAILQVVEGNKVKKSKEELDRLVKAEESLQFKSDQIKPLPWLSVQAKKVFKRLVKEFEGIDLLKNVDVFALSLFADAYSSYVECTKIIEKDGHLIEGSRAAEAGVVAHPLIAKKIQLAAQMDKQMSKLGLSPVDRAKLVHNLMPPNDTNGDNPFANRL